MTAATTRNRRTRNEDAIGLNGWVMYGDPIDPLDVTMLLRPDAPVLVAVADGMAGAPDGHRAARIAVERLTARGADHPDQNQWIRAAFAEADTAIRNATNEHSHGMGCTAAVLVIDSGGTATVANVGDVRVYRIVDRYAGQLTEDHRSGEGPTVDRCLGGLDISSAVPYVYGLPVRPGDRLLMCSDGFHDAVPAPAIERIVRQANSRSVVIDLTNAAIQARQGDNVTVVVIDVVGPRPVPRPHQAEAPHPPAGSGPSVSPSAPPGAPGPRSALGTTPARSAEPGGDSRRRRWQWPW